MAARASGAGDVQMAIGYVDMVTHSRARGHSAAAALAYRFGVSLVNTRTGVIHDYRARHTREDIAATGIVSHRDTPLTESPQVLADAIEGAERRHDARILRDLKVALPHELDEPARIALAQTIARDIAEHYDTVTAWAVHRPGPDGDARNHHAHIVIPTRALADDAQFGAKLRTLDNPRSSGDEVAALRNRYAELTNQALERAGRSERIDAGQILEGVLVESAGRELVAEARKSQTGRAGRRVRRTAARDVIAAGVDAGDLHSERATRIAQQHRRRVRKPRQERWAESRRERWRIRYALADLGDWAAPTVDPDDYPLPAHLVGRDPERRLAVWTPERSPADDDESQSMQPDAETMPATVAPVQALALAANLTPIIGGWLRATPDPAAQPVPMPSVRRRAAASAAPHVEPEPDAGPEAAPRPRQGRRARGATQVTPQGNAQPTAPTEHEPQHEMIRELSGTLETLGEHAIRAAAGDRAGAQRARARILRAAPNLVRNKPARTAAATAARRLTVRYGVAPGAPQGTVDRACTQWRDAAHTHGQSLLMELLEAILDALLGGGAERGRKRPQPGAKRRVPVAPHTPPPRAIPTPIGPSPPGPEALKERKRVLTELETRKKTVPPSEPAHVRPPARGVRLQAAITKAGEARGEKIIQSSAGLPSPDLADDLEQETIAELSRHVAPFVIPPLRPTDLGRGFVRNPSLGQIEYHKEKVETAIQRWRAHWRQHAQPITSALLDVVWSPQRQDEYAAEKRRDIARDKDERAAHAQWERDQAAAARLVDQALDQAPDPNAWSGGGGSGLGC